MSRKQLFRQSNNQTVAEIFERFVASQTAKGVSDKTIQNYYSHLHSLQKHLDFSAPLATLTKEDLDNMVISMRQSGLAHNSISSYLRVFRTFLNWARKAGYTELELVLNMLAEATTTEISKQKAPEGLRENIEVARSGGKVAGDARKAIEQQTGVSVITSKNAAQLNRVVTDLIESAESFADDDKKPEKKR